MDRGIEEKNELKIKKIMKEAEDETTIEFEKIHLKKENNNLEELLKNSKLEII